MSCCGNRRVALRTPTIPRVAPAAPAPLPPAEAVWLAARGEGAMVMRGAATGLTYVFGARGAALAVDARDVAQMMGTGRFRRV